MDYSYYVPPDQPYQFYGIPDKSAHQYTSQAGIQQDPLSTFNDPNGYQFFDQDAPFDPSTLVAQPQSPLQSLPNNTSIPNMTQYDSSGSIPADLNAEDFVTPRQGSSECDEDRGTTTPALSRRKAQNRAAQRAFRERKERHVKDLELKLKAIEAQSTDLLTDNERLRRELDKLATQNEILRATRSTPTTTEPSPHHSFTNTHEHINQQHQPPEEESGVDPDSLIAAGPTMVYSPHSFIAAFAVHGVQGSYSEPISHRIEVSPQTGERLLATGAAWDLIQKHELYRRGMVDLAEVVDRLREKAICDGAGPSFPEAEVVRALEECVGVVPGDELI